MKRILSLVLALALVVSMCPAVFAAEETTVEPTEKTLTLKSGSTEEVLLPGVTYYLALDESVEMPSTLTWNDAVVTIGSVVTSPYALTGNIKGAFATVTEETKVTFKIEAVEEEALPTLKMGANAIEVTDTWNGTIVSVATAGKYILSAAEGEENADIYIETATGSEWVELPYAFNVADEAVNFIVLTLDWAEDTIDLVLHKHELKKTAGVRATCTEEGNIEYYQCTGCLKYFADEAATDEITSVKELVISPMGHERLDYVEAVAATHTVNGNYDYYYCSVCDAADGEIGNDGFYEDGNRFTTSALTKEETIVYALGHSKALKFELIPATHTTPGCIEYYYCSVCDAADGVMGNDGMFTTNTADGEALTHEELVINPTGHPFGELEALVPATCAEPGVRAHLYCEECDAYFESRMSTDPMTEDDLVIEPLGHVTKLEHKEAVDATCEKPGNAEYWYCNRCEEYLDMTGDPTAEPKDLNGDGYINNVDLYTVVSETQVLFDALGHDDRPIEVYDAVAPTHTDDGHLAYAICSKCGCYLLDNIDDSIDAVYVKADWETEILDKATGHTRAEKKELDPTCTETGLKPYFYCAKCGKNYEVVGNEVYPAADAKEITDLTTLEIPALGHKLTYYAESPATCTAEGRKAHYVCDTCGELFGADKKVVAHEDLAIPALGHDSVLKAVKESTHTADGMIEHYECKVCKEVFDAGENPAETKVIDASIKPLTEEEYTIVSNGHMYAEKHEAVKPTCNVDGNIEYWYCSSCDKYYLPTEGTKFPSKDAEELSTSVKENNDKPEWVILAMGHTNATKYTGKPATHTEDGIRDYYYCEVCDGMYEGRAPEAAELTQAELVLLAEGHVRAELVTMVKPTCNKNGNIEYYYCADCDAADGVVDGKGLDGMFEGRAPEAAELTVEEVTLYAQGHTNATKYTGYPATHTTEGRRDYYYCEICDAMFEGRAPEADELTHAELVIDALGHWNAEYIDGTATCTEAGTADYFYCTICDEYYAIPEDSKFPTADAEPINPDELDTIIMGHKNVTYVPEVTATCTEDGNYEYWYCSACENYLQKTEENTDANGDGEINALDVYEIVDEEYTFMEHTNHSTRPTVLTAEPATHTSNGWYERLICNNPGCGVYLKVNEGTEGGKYIEADEKEFIDYSLGHEFAEKVPGKAATHTEDGNVPYFYCSICKANYEVIDNEVYPAYDAAELTDEEIKLVAAGHVRAELIPGTPATHTENGIADSYYCGVCKETFESRAADAEVVTDEDLVILASGHIRASLVPGKAATHTENGIKDCYYCAECDKKFENRGPEAAEVTEEWLTILASGHIRAELVAAVPATCNTDGTAAYYYCADCNGKFESRAPEAEKLTDEAIKLQATGHTRAILVPQVDPTYTTPGVRAHYYCPVCEAAFAGRAPEAAEIKDLTIPALTDPFIDVDPTDYYFAPAVWAYENGIAGGDGKGNFNGDDSCTRAQIVYMMWKINGAPVVTTEKTFSDIKGHWAYDAILWAAEEGITSGVGAGKFGPDVTVTREQAMTMIWVAVGAPVVSTSRAFNDVKAGDYFFNAVQWAAASGLTAGYPNGNFGVGDVCTRAHIITFLYNAFN